MNSRSRSPTMANFSNIDTLTRAENVMNLLSSKNCCPTVALLIAYIRIIGKMYRNRSIARPMPTSLANSRKLSSRNDPVKKVAGTAM